MTFTTDKGQTDPVTTPRHFYGRELRNAVVAALAAVPAVQTVSFLQYFGEHSYFVRLEPRNVETIGQVDAAVQAAINSHPPVVRTCVNCRELEAGEPMPSSAVQFQR